jgi:TM2 domain-containing membrane protein YozV
VLYLIFCWTFIPALVGFIEGIIYLATSEQEFERKYG